MLKAAGKIYPPGPLMHPGFISGGQYPTAPTSSSVAAVGAVDIIYLIPYMPKVRALIQKIGLRVVTGGAGSSVKMGVWRNNRTTMRPTGTAIASNNTGLATTANNTTVMLTVTPFRTVPGKLIWIGGKFTGTLPTTPMPLNTSTELAELFGVGIGSTAAATAQGVSTPHAYATDIGELDMGSAVFTTLLSTTVPNYILEA